MTRDVTAGYDRWAHGDQAGAFAPDSPYGGDAEAVLRAAREDGPAGVGALGLDWGDVEFGGRPMLHVRRQFYRGSLRRLKSRAGRRDLPLSAGLARAPWAARPAGADGPVFRTRNGTRYLDRNVRRILDPATVRAGVPWASFHTFRHTCASTLFDGGKNIKQVAEWLGHTDPAFTLRTYVHLMDQGLGGADFLDAAITPAAGPPAAAVEAGEPDAAEATG